MRLISEDLFKGGYGKSKLLFIIDGLLRNAVGVLTTGVFLSGYVVFLKGSDFMTGLINSSTNWVAVIALFSFFIFERRRKRKRLLITLFAASRLLSCSLVFLPLAVKDRAAVLHIVIFMAISGNVLSSVYNTGFMAWLFGIQSQGSKNEYIYVLTFFSRISATLASLAGGVVMDLCGKGYAGFLLIFGASLLLSLIDTILLAYVREPEYNMGKAAAPGRDVLLEPLSLYTATTFTPLYMIRYLKLNYSFISSVSVVQNLLVYGLLPGSTIYLFYLAPVLSGIGYNGFNIALLNRRYSLIPENNRTAYEGWYGTAVGASALAAPILGSLLLKSLPVLHNALFQHSDFQLLYLISFIFAVITLLTVFPSDNERKNPKNHSFLPRSSGTME